MVSTLPCVSSVAGIVLSSDILCATLDLAENV